MSRPREGQDEGKEEAAEPRLVRDDYALRPCDSRDSKCSPTDPSEVFACLEDGKDEEEEEKEEVKRKRERKKGKK